MTYSLENNAALFKETYSGISRNHYNSDTLLLGRTKKSFKLQGLKDHVSIPMGMSGGFGGGVGGYLPDASTENGELIEITAKEVYGRALVKRKAMKAAMTDRGAFVRITKRPVEKTVERYNSGLNYLLFGDGTGRLGKTAATGYVSGGATAPVLQMDDTDYFTWFERAWQKNDIVNIGIAADTDVEDAKLKVTAIDKANKRITFSRIAGSWDASSGTNADARWIYIQNMFKAAPQGLAGIVSNTSAAMYGVNYDADTWGSVRVNAAGAPPSVQLLDEAVSDIIIKVGKGGGPRLIVTSPEIYRILRSVHESKKRYNLEPRARNLRGIAKFGFSGLEYDTEDGRTIGIFADRHCRPTSIFLLNDEFMELHHMPGQGWFDEDGKVFARVADRDEYEARYGGYLEFVIHPTFQAEIYGVGLIG